MLVNFQTRIKIPQHIPTSPKLAQFLYSPDPINMPNFKSIGQHDLNTQIWLVENTSSHKRSFKHSRNQGETAFSTQISEKLYTTIKSPLHWPFPRNFAHTPHDQSAARTKNFRWIGPPKPPHFAPPIHGIISAWNRDRATLLNATFADSSSKTPLTSVRVAR